MKTALGRRFALMTMGLGMAAGAAGLAVLHDGAARAAEPSLLLLRRHVARYLDGAKPRSWCRLT